MYKCGGRDESSGPIPRRHGKAQTIDLSVDVREKGVARVPQACQRPSGKPRHRISPARLYCARATPAPCRRTTLRMIGAGRDRYGIPVRRIEHASRARAISGRPRAAPVIEYRCASRARPAGRCTRARRDGRTYMYTRTRTIL